RPRRFAFRHGGVGSPPSPPTSTPPQGTAPLPSIWQQLCSAAATCCPNIPYSSGSEAEAEGEEAQALALQLADKSRELPVARTAGGRAGGRATRAR
uniref:Uncharacterized protein n=1 Tax=Triticum urartu TaxID=4572 RepID=A0A8R7TYX9_TRIUA